MRIGRPKLLTLLLPVMTGCLRHTRVLQQPELTTPIGNLDVLQLVETINRRYDQISSLTATLDFGVTVVGFWGDGSSWNPPRRGNRLHSMFGLPPLSETVYDPRANPNAGACTRTRRISPAMGRALPC
jgi:hypothetical protein